VGAELTIASTVGDGALHNSSFLGGPGAAAHRSSPSHRIGISGTFLSRLKKERHN
jgi:hypothetical protein